MIQNDNWIIQQSLKADMITPFEEKQVSFFGGKKVISFGVSSFGYDMRCTDEFRLTKTDGSLLDPKYPSELDACFEETVRADSIIIPPHGFALTRSLEYFRIPEDVICIVLGKSTYARVGLIVNVTPLEPSWEGHVTIELTNSTPLPVKVYANEGIAQVLFLKGSSPEVTYASRNGKYNGQTGIVLSKV